MLDIAVAYNRFSFVGQEFLTWLWFISETQDDIFQKVHEEITDLRLGNRMVLQNRYGDDRIETLTIKGDTAGLEEAMVALQKGAVVTEMQIIFTSGEHEWSLTLKGEHLGLSGLKTPETASIKEIEETEGAVIEKFFLIHKAYEITDKLFIHFIKIRTGEIWNNTLLLMREWVKKSNEGKIHT
ncbi:hypothetical protein LZ24_00583 [Desulfobotulus alkaliphilus]|uniref:Uncharacterized protein n=1 Tax=Desulfobotulus alkaliphilus TaxID=622671 RepID=A0A562S4G1_9BACT|nr:hypothetical protein [Desulfobotulus alkaliphilus]TWI75536.1 hypothetical protein LZ24_00583 [Desulfobotulus alkaliphilus]